MEINTLLIVQARLGSTRLPGKVMKKIGDMSLLEILLHRLSKSKTIDHIVLATTKNPIDSKIIAECNRLDIESYRGSEDDVLDRFYQVAKDKNPKWIVRVTADCPLLDPELLDDIVNFSLEKNVDYCTNTLIEDYPDGQDVEVFRLNALKEAWSKAKLKSEREHVTSYIRNNSDFYSKNSFKAIDYPCNKNYSHIRMTVDEPSDFVLIESLVDRIGIDKNWKEYVEYIMENNLDKINNDIVRNEGYLKSLQNEKNDK